METRERKLAFFIRDRHILFSDGSSLNFHAGEIVTVIDINEGIVMVANKRIRDMDVDYAYIGIEHIKLVPKEALNMEEVDAKLQRLKEKYCL